MNKILSVIIPTYNMEKLLPRCLGSFLLDDDLLRRKLDVIVVNDGSNDRSSEIAHEFAARDVDMFRVIDKKNGNYGSCINVGLKAALGKYVKVLDADDSFDKGGLSRLVSYLSDSDCDMVLTNWLDEDDSQNVIGYCRLNLMENESVSVAKFLKQNPSLQMCSMTFRKEILDEMGYRQTEGISYTDVEWSFLPLTRVRKISFLPIVVYRILSFRQGQTSDVFVKRKNYWMLSEMFIGLLKKYERLQDGIDKETRISLNAFLGRYAEGMYRNGLKIRANLDFIKFDAALLEANPEVYVLAGQMPRGRIKFNIVKWWRKGTTGAWFLVWCYCRLCEIKSWLGVK